MIYLERFKFTPYEIDADITFSEIYETKYPFGILSKHKIECVDFMPITIFYGGNGSGKSTALNLIANKIEAEHDAVYNRSNFFEDYLNLCKIKFEDETYKNKVILTSDGVFDCMLDIRHLNQRIDVDRNQAFDEYMHWKMISTYGKTGSAYYHFSNEDIKEFEEIKRHPLAHFQQYKQINMANTKTQSQYIRRNVADNVREMSNGESAFEYFIHRITQDGIFILDEPENSLSPALQVELVKYLQDTAKYCNSQLIIATHSPFILSIAGAKIYDLDAYPVDIKSWTELGNVRAYYNLFKQHEDEFETYVEEKHSVVKRRSRTKEGQSRKILKTLLENLGVSDDVKTDIFFMMKSDRMMDNYIDYVTTNIPAGLDIEELEDRLLIAAEKM